MMTPAESFPETPFLPEILISTTPIGADTALR